jgi:hypothetical protein
MPARAAVLFPDRDTVQRHLRVALASIGAPVAKDGFLEVPLELLDGWRRLRHATHQDQAPVDGRIQAFIDRICGPHVPAGSLRLPDDALVLSHPGIARELSLPKSADEHHTSLLSSYRIRQGVLHNPKSDRRTTAGSFHVAEVGPPVQADKKAVPVATFARLLAAALKPSQESLRLPWAAGSDHEINTWVGLLLRPLVHPEVPGVMPRKAMEIRFFAPGSLVSNLDFVESIFGNAGDPRLPENDAALDTDHWTGTTGCVILAPHLTELTKKDLGLPAWSEATDRQRAEGMAWKDPAEKYNEGSAFKCCLRTLDGVVVTLIADNYYGYCKKEVKTQISFSANLFGGCEEEHAGGALARAAFNLGEEWSADGRVETHGQTFADVAKGFADIIEVTDEGYAVDRRDNRLVYVPEDAHFNAVKQTVSWKADGQARSIRLRPNHVYMLPHGYSLRFERHTNGSLWRLIGTEAEGVLCHKPCTVSGGGKSEISKSIDNAFIYGPIYVGSLEKDLDQIQALIDKDYSQRFRPEFMPDYTKKKSRGMLAPERSLGSVIKLFTPSPTEFTAEYNAWLKTIPHQILNLLFIVKRFHRPEWGADWRKHFTVDTINGEPGHELRLDGRKITGSYVRVGFGDEGEWRTYKLRVDFIPADKVQWEDDISASAIVPAEWLPGFDKNLKNPAHKLVENCEMRFFQRPDEAIHRGFDKQAEADLSSPGSFISNFEPLTRERTREIVDDAVGFEQFTKPVRDLLTGALGDASCSYVVSSAHPRMVGGKPSKNPRYLQVRPDLIDGFPVLVSEMAARLHRQLPMDRPLTRPVVSVLAGRRNNAGTPAKGKEGAVRPLCCFNPIHYQELPELFMEWISSLTGKSPSTTGAGSEGALTKGPFNCLPTTADLNNAFVGMALTRHGGFTTSAGVIGQDRRVDHDVSLLIPEIWCRLPVQARDASYLCKEGHLERIADYDYKGRRIMASRLGWRITARFVHTFFGRVFSNPAAVFDEAMLKPETQDGEAYADSVDNIVEAHRHVAEAYLADGTVALACPPLQALLHIMATGSWQGKGIDHPEVRAMFTREAVLGSDWYRRRLETQRDRDVALWKRHVQALEWFLASPAAGGADRLALDSRLARARARLHEVTFPGYVDSLTGFLGADPVA